MKKKLFILAAVSLMTSAAHAARTDVKTIDLSNVKLEDTVSLKAETYRTEYKSEYVQHTCENQVCNGTRQECHTESTPESCGWESSGEVCKDDRSCEIVNGVRECSVTPVCTGGDSTYVCSGGSSEEVCEDVADCHSESYDCSAYENIPYEVLDHSTEASVRVVFKDITTGLSVKEKLVVSLNGDTVTVSSTAKTSNAIIFGVLSQKENVIAGVKTIEAVMTMKASPVADLVSPLSGAKVLDVQNGVLTIETNPTKTPELLALDLSVQSKSLPDDPVIASGSVSLINATSAQAGAKTQWKMDLKGIGLDWATLASGKYKIEWELKANLDTSKIINISALPKLKSVSDSIKFKK